MTKKDLPSCLPTAPPYFCLAYKVTCQIQGEILYAPVVFIAHHCFSGSVPFEACIKKSKPIIVS